MCTVTIIPKGTQDFILTSNRDEAPERVSLDPELYNFNNTTMLYPKDKQSGGSWIGVSDKNRVLCLLNGGFKLHERKLPYRKSRGEVVKELLTVDDIVSAVNEYNFNNIEPFTLVIADWNEGLRFFELVWDGTLHFKELPLKPMVWSSSTLYNDAMKDERKQWFKNHIENKELTAEVLLKFHTKAGRNNLEYGVVMDRGFVKTTSITQMIKQADEVSMCFKNLQKETIAKKNFNLLVNG